MRLCLECKQDYARTNDGLCISCVEGLIEGMCCDLIEKDEKIAELEAELLKACSAIDEEQYAEKKLRRDIKELEFQLREEREC